MQVVKVTAKMNIPEIQTGEVFAVPLSFDITSASKQVFIYKYEDLLSLDQNDSGSFIFADILSVTTDFLSFLLRNLILSYRNAFILSTLMCGFVMENGYG